MHFFIDRPVFAAVLSIVFLIVGGVGLLTLPIAQYPEVAPPVVSVTATYPGADAKVVADTIATPIEQEVNGVENMIYMESRSANDGTMTLNVTFALGTDLNFAQVLVQNRVSIAESKLPEEARRQGVTTKKKSPSILLAVNLVSPDGRYDQLYLSNYATIQIKDALARLPGVGDVTFLGARDYSMRVWLEPDRMANLNLVPADVIAAVSKQNKQVAAGRVGAPPTPPGVPFQFTVTTQGRLITEEEFGQIIVKVGKDGQVVRLSDVARIELGAKNYDVDCHVDGKPSVMLAAFQLPGSNALETAKGIRAEMERLKERFPEGLDYEIHYDTTIFVDESIHEVYKTFFEAILLVFIVVLVFLQTWRATVIPMIAVPVSLVGTFFFMKLFGFSLNNLSLFGLVLAIGIVVDDAIVVVENVERNLEMGLAPREACYRAMEEVTGPVIAIALVLCAVFVPTAFITGISGQFYRQFALTIAVSTVISAFNSLSLSPALSRLLLKPHGAPKDFLTKLLDLTLGWFFRGFNAVFQAAIAGYGRIVQGLIRVSILVLAVYGGLLFLAYVGFTTVPAGFIPEQDKGYLLVNAQLPDGASLERTGAVMKELDRICKETEGIAHTLTLSGYSALSSLNLSNVGAIYVILEEFEKRAHHGLTANKILGELRKKFAKVDDAVVIGFGAPVIDGLGNAGGFKLMVQDRSSAGLFQLKGALNRMMAVTAEQGTIVGLYSSFTVNQPQVFLDLDRVQAMSQGIDLDDVFGTLQAYMGSAYVNDFTRFNRNWQVNVQADSLYRSRVEDIGRLFTRNQAGEMVPLSTLIKVDYTTGPAIVTHYNMFPAAEMTGTPLPGVSSGQVIQTIRSVAEQELPRTMGYEWTEIYFQQIAAGNTAPFVFALGSVFVFLVLAAQYESWSLPLAIILIVPMCLTAAIWGVFFFGDDVNIFTQIGLVVLIGLAAKNAILIVEFAKQIEDQGKPLLEATLEACKQRLRPILMTSFAFGFGVVPLVVGRGAGFEMRVALGVAVLTGMIGVTVFGIFLTPVFYYVVRWFSGGKTGQVPAAAGSPTGDLPATHGDSAHGEHAV